MFIAHRTIKDVSYFTIEDVRINNLKEKIKLYKTVPCFHKPQRMYEMSSNECMLDGIRFKNRRVGMAGKH